MLLLMTCVINGVVRESVNHEQGGSCSSNGEDRTNDEVLPRARLSVFEP